MKHVVDIGSPGIDFYRFVSTVTRDIDTAILTVSPSVRDVPGLDENGLTHCHSFSAYTVAKSF